MKKCIQQTQNSIYCKYKRTYTTNAKNICRKYVIERSKKTGTPAERQEFRQAHNTIEM